LRPRVGANTRRRVPGAMASASSPGELVAPIRSNPAATTRNVIMGRPRSSNRAIPKAGSG
jgi:hypothetical protein